MGHMGQLPNSINDSSVQQFLAKWGLSDPVYLDYVDYGYDPAWCHISAQHRVITDGGKRVHGWALWQFGPDLVAEHHSIWENATGNLVDVTPPSNGGRRILFVRDDNARIKEDGGSYLLFTDRTADPVVHWLWQGNPSDYSNWPCAPNKPDLVDYCKKLGVPVTAILD